MRRERERETCNQEKDKMWGEKTTIIIGKQRIEIQNLGPPHLALNPPSFSVVLFILVFLLCWEKKKLLPAQKRRVFLFIFEGLPFVLPSLSHFPFSLSPSLSGYFLVFFLTCFPLLFPSLFCCIFYCLASLLLFHAKKNIKILHLKGSSHQYFIMFFWVSCSCLVIRIPFCDLCFLLLAPAHLTLPLFVFVSCFCCRFPFLCWFYVCCFCLFFVCKKCPKKGELAHYPPYSPSSKKFVWEVVAFEHTSF